MKLKLKGSKQILKMEILNLSKTWVSFLNVSVKMHADGIAGIQINQTWNWEIENLYEWINKCTM